MIVGATVNVRDGAYKGKRATVRGIYKDTAFLFESSFKQTGGIFVERVKNLIVLTTNAYDSSAKRIRQVNPSMMEASIREREKSSMDQTKKSFNLKESRSSLIGKMKRIIRGPYKGRDGYVKNTMGDKVSMQIITLNKLVAVPIDYLNIDKEDKALFKEGGKTPMYTPRHQTHFGSNVINTPAYMNTPSQNMATPYVTTPSANTPGGPMSPSRSPNHAYGFNA